METQLVAVPVLPSGKLAPILAPGPNDDIPTISRSELPSVGCPWKDTQLCELIKAGKFPEPYRPSARKRFWSPRQIRDFLASKMPKTGGAA